MKQRTLFIADDGQEFESAEEAEKHERVLASVEAIDRFLTNRETRQRKVPEYRKVILAWEAFRS